MCLGHAYASSWRAWSNTQALSFSLKHTHRKSEKNAAEEKANEAHLLHSCLVFGSEGIYHSCTREPYKSLQVLALQQHLAKMKPF